MCGEVQNRNKVVSSGNKSTVASNPPRKGCCVNPWRCVNPSHSSTHPYLVEAHDITTNPKVPDEVLVESHTSHVEPIGGEGELRTLC